MGSIPLRDHLPSRRKPEEDRTLSNCIPISRQSSSSLTARSPKAIAPTAVPSMTTSPTTPTTAPSSRQAMSRPARITCLDHRRTVEPCTRRGSGGHRFPRPAPTRTSPPASFSHSSPAPLTYFLPCGERIHHLGREHRQPNTAFAETARRTPRTPQTPRSSLIPCSTISIPSACSKPCAYRHPSLHTPDLRRTRTPPPEEVGMPNGPLLTHPLLIDDHPLKSRPVDTGLHFPAPGTHRPPQRTRRDTEVRRNVPTDSC